MTDLLSPERIQAWRARTVRRRLREVGDYLYDAGFGLVRHSGAKGGHMVAEDSLEYALLLLDDSWRASEPAGPPPSTPMPGWFRSLENDAQEGDADRAEANRIIQQVLRYQDLRPNSPTYGNFFWRAHWDRVRDLNAVSFLAAGLAYVTSTFRGLLYAPTIAALERALPPTLAAIRRHRVPWQYTNIFFLNLAALVGLASVLGDTSAYAVAEELFDTWLEGTSTEGVHEFNSPTYTPISLAALEAAWATTPSPAFREQLERALEVLVYQFAVNFCPNGHLGGAPARAYRHDFASGSLASIYAYVKFGTPLELSPEPAAVSLLGANLTLHGYVPPPDIRMLACERGRHAEVHDRLVSPENRRTHVVRPRFSLSSQSIKQVEGKPAPPYILLIRAVSGPRAAVPFLPAELPHQAPVALFRSRQHGTRVVGVLHQPLTGVNRARFLADPTLLCEPTLLLGLRNHLQHLLVSGKSWSGEAWEMPPEQTLVISYGDIYLGLMTAIPPGCTNRMCRLLLQRDTGGEVRLSLRLYGGPDLRESDTPQDLWILLDVTDAREDLPGYAAWLRGWHIDGRAAEPLTCVATHEDGSILPSFYGEGDSDPLEDALHMSPRLTLRPGDLARFCRTGGSLLHASSDRAWP